MSYSQRKLSCFVFLFTARNSSLAFGCRIYLFGGYGGFLHIGLSEWHWYCTILEYNTFPACIKFCYCENPFQLSYGLKQFPDQAWCRHANDDIQLLDVVCHIPMPQTLISLELTYQQVIKRNISWLFGMPQSSCVGEPKVSIMRL